MWEGSDIDLVVVRREWEGVTPDYHCRLINGVIVHSTILTLRDLKRHDPKALRWLKGIKILEDEQKIIENSLQHIPEINSAVKTPSIRKALETLLNRSQKPLQKGDAATAVIRLREGALRFVSTWLGAKGIHVRSGGRRSFDQIMKHLDNLEQTDITKSLLNLYQADVETEEAEKTVNETINLSTRVYCHLYRTGLIEHLTPNELGLMKHASSAEELGDFLEALHRPVARHYPRSSVVYCEFTAISLAERLMQAIQHAQGKEYDDGVLVRSLVDTTNLPDLFLRDFMKLSRLPPSEDSQTKTIEMTTNILKRLT